MWWLILALAHAQPVRSCTDAGPLVGEIADDGTLSGLLGGRLPVSGTRDAATIRGPDGTVRWTGALSDLHPRDPRKIVGLDAVTTHVIDFFETIGSPLGCPLGGPSTVLVGKWPVPVALPKGAWVVATTDVDVLVRTPNGVGWLREAPLGPTLAADVASELREWLPGLSTSVVVRDGRALVIATNGFTVDAGPSVAPAPQADLDVLPLLRPPRALLDTHPLEKAEIPAAGAAYEMLVEANSLRVSVGLPPYEIDGYLDYTALAHCAYLEWAARSGRAIGHGQDADSPVFLGSTPLSRSGGSEVVAFEATLLPWESVSSWIQTPFHRSPLLDPRPGKVGACATMGGPRVMEVLFDAPIPVAPFAFPIDGQAQVPLAFDGLEIPDPVPFPDRVAPMGFPLTVWLQIPTASFTAAEGWVRDDAGADLPSWVVTPANHPFLAAAPQAEVHVIPKAPLAPGRTYTWGVRVKVAASPPARSKKKAEPAEEWREWSGTFTTMSTVDKRAPVPVGIAALLATGLDEKRVALGARRLTLDHDASVGAVLVAEGGVEALSGMLLAERLAYSCWTDAQAEAAVRTGAWPEGLLDPGLTRIGFRTAGKRTCAVVASPGLRPPRWDPRP